MVVVNVAEEVLSGVLQAAEQLQGSFLAAETSAVECLRWAGAMPLLLRDLGVQNVLQAQDLLQCRTPSEIRRLLLLGEEQSAAHVALMVSGFLWDYEADLQRLLALGVIRRLTICSSLSERAHECYDFSRGNGDTTVAPGARATKTMKFDDFATDLEKSMTFPVEKNTRESVKQVEVNKEAAMGNGNGEDEDWGWTEDEEGSRSPRKEVVTQNGATAGVQVLHLPLNVVPLLSSKKLTPEPSVFVLSHPTCAAAFPLLLHQVDDVVMASPASPTGRARAGSGDAVKKYAHVKDVLPGHIPSAFRRSMRLLAYTLAEMMVGARLDVKERIFALGATSLKIGHTLLRILNELDEDATTQSLQGKQGASVIIVDRTCDLSSPCSFGSSLLDRILALLPQTLTSPASSQDKSTTRTKLHVTEIFPIHGCHPEPLGVPPPIRETLCEFGYHPSEFVSQIQWKGGASLCHPTIPSGSNVFRSLAFRPAKLALRDLDKRLQAVEHALLQQGSIQRTAITRKPGEKARGRDVVLRRISKILEAGEPTNLEYSSLVELGVIILETLERMDKSQLSWDKCHERAERQLQLRKQGGREWIIPEVADAVQRQSSAGEEVLSLQELLTLLVHAFALSSGAPLEDFTIQMIEKVLTDKILQTATTDSPSLQAALPELFDQLAPYISTTGSHVSTSDAAVEAHDGDDWGWNDGSTSPNASKKTHAPTHNGGFQLTEAKSIIEAQTESLIGPLKDCAQQFVEISDDKFTSTGEESPRSLVAKLCRSIVNPSGSPISELEHIVDASEQLTRAGIDLLKSGFSKFGFGGGSGGGQRGTNVNRLLGESNVLMVFVVGGITFEEIQEVHDALSDNSKYQIILGGTTITNNEVILTKLFG